MNALPKIQEEKGCADQMSGAAYYNEIDPFAAQWLRELIKKGAIASGEVDERSIKDVKASDIKGYKQCHFFAGIGVWSYALRQAGWSDDRQVWTGSCPCQPFSTAGKKRGVDDDRHLWPEFYRLISECKPSAVFGEQVASKDGLAWLDIVQADLEAANYATAAVDLCAASIGAPHIRQRLWFVAERMADTNSGSGRLLREERGQKPKIIRGSKINWMADTASDRRTGEGACTEQTTVHRNPSQTNGHWRDADWLKCKDGRWRPVEPCTSPLAHGITNRVGRLRGYGNGLCAPQAKAFISAYLTASTPPSGGYHGPSL